MRFICLLLLIGSIFPSCDKRQQTTFRVLQINLWHEGAMMEGGFEGIVDIITQTSPDVVLLCEIRNNDFITRLTTALREKGEEYTGENFDMSIGLISRFPLENTSFIRLEEDSSRSLMKASVQIAGQPFVFYSAHLDYTHYECYLPRGYSGTTWQKIEAPVTNADSVLAANRIAMRDEAITAFLRDAHKEVQAGSFIILGGDFNEPSHLDWQEDTKDLWDHNGAVINWDCSVMLHQAGFSDTYREVYPSAVTHPGFTYPAGNREVELKDLCWAPEVDERDRIDFIYYYARPELTLKSVSIVGPAESVAYGQIQQSTSEDTFLQPEGIWPTDHKAMLAVFTLTTNKNK
ncbi:MAG: endonuclease/exonuclease/phosphatase family protein [Tannerellaceae bacterium]|nr:endonuclease/exonuclease/phosphatase family protein [Tannerellaceae bacterium]